MHLCCTCISLELWDPRHYCRIDEFIIEEGALSKVVPCKLCHLPFGGRNLLSSRLSSDLF